VRSLTAFLLLSVDVADKGAAFSLAAGASRLSADIDLRCITILRFVIHTMGCLTEDIHHTVFVVGGVLGTDLRRIAFAAGIAGLYCTVAAYVDVADATIVVLVVGTVGYVTA
jgi:hypothetical protein